MGEQSGSPPGGQVRERERGGRERERRQTDRERERDREREKGQVQDTVPKAKPIRTHFLRQISIRF
jgi:hypothetical protein